jgi:hypothetical protein
MAALGHPWPSRHLGIPAKWNLTRYAGSIPNSRRRENEKSHPEGGFFHFWWRRRESNPRPQVIHLQLYMLSRVFDLTVSYPTGRENWQRVRYF